MSSHHISRSYVTRTVPVGGTRTIISPRSPVSGTRTIISPRSPVSSRMVTRTVPVSSRVVRTVRTGSPLSSVSLQSHLHDHGDLERRQRDWEDEIDRFRKDFYRSTPFEESVLREPRLKLFPETNTEVTTEKTVRRSPEPKPREFSVEFPLRDYKPEEISVKVLGSTLTVSAESDASSGLTRSFSKSVGLPSYVDGDKLISTFNDDGVLRVALPAPPDYESVNGDDDTEASDQLDDSIARALQSDEDHANAASALLEDSISRVLAEDAKKLSL